MADPKRRVLVTASTLHAAAVTQLEAAGLELAFMPGAVDEASLVAALATGSVEAIVLRGNPPITRAVLAAAPVLRVIAKHGAGVDSVDLAAASEAGIVVATAGDTGASAVAEFAFAMIMALERNLLPLTERMRNGRWDRGGFLGHELYGRTLGIIGLGRIGRRVAGFARVFGMRLLTLHRAGRSVADIEAVPLDELLARADILTLHCPLTEETRHLIDAAAIVRMKRGALLVNTGRGPLVDEQAVAAALNEGQLGGAAFDVFETEPLAADNPLRQAPNVILTPHIASQTDGAIARTALQVADNILAVLGGRPIDPALLAAPLPSSNEVSR